MYDEIEYKVAIGYNFFTGYQYESANCITSQHRTNVLEPRFPAKSIGTTTILIKLAVCLLLQMGMSQGQRCAQ